MGILLILTGLSQLRPQAEHKNNIFNLAILSAERGTPSILILNLMGTPAGILNLPVPYMS
jgi:hypothetical protein